MNLSVEDLVHPATTDGEVRISQIGVCLRQRDGDVIGPSPQAVGARRIRVADALCERVTKSHVAGEDGHGSNLEWTKRCFAIHIAVDRRLDVNRPTVVRVAVTRALHWAIRCAMAIRDAVQSFGIEVRAGLHTGECEVRGDDIGGIAVHIGARVSALAGPNDVLVSSTLRDLVIGSGLEFEARGAHELKGVPGEWNLFAVTST